MIPEPDYSAYLHALLAGDSCQCITTVQRLLDSRTAPTRLYTDLFQRSLYRVGELWESNQVPVAVEHLATAITERALALVYPRILGERRRMGRKAVISCSVNEFHQVGARMVADILEMNGWEAFFLGANMPADDLLQMIQAKAPDVLGLSLSIYFNLASLIRLLEIVRSHFPNLDIIVGGQAFRWGGTDAIAHFPNVTHIASIHQVAGIGSQ